MKTVFIRFFVLFSVQGLRSGLKSGSLDALTHK